MPASEEWDVKRRDESLRVIEADLYQLPGRHYVAVAREITERKRLEERNRARARVVDLLAADGSLEEVLDAVARGVERECCGSRCRIPLPDENGGWLQFPAAPDLPRLRMERIDVRVVGKGGGRYPTACCRPVRTVAGDKSRGTEIGSCWSEPILDADDRCSGVLTVCQDAPSSPHRAVLEAVEQASNLARIATRQSRRTAMLCSLDDLFRRLSQQLAAIIDRLRRDTCGTACGSCSGKPNRSFRNRLHAAYGTVGGPCVTSVPTIGIFLGRVCGASPRLGSSGGGSIRFYRTDRQSAAAKGAPPPKSPATQPCRGTAAPPMSTDGSRPA